MGSTEPPSTPPRPASRDLSPELMRCGECGLPYEDGPHASGTAGCPECDPTLRLRARARAARRARRGHRAAPLARAA